MRISLLSQLLNVTVRKSKYGVCYDFKKQEILRRKVSLFFVEKQIEYIKAFLNIVLVTIAEYPQHQFEQLSSHLFLYSCLWGLQYLPYRWYAGTSTSLVICILFLALFIILIIIFFRLVALLWTMLSVVDEHSDQHFGEAVGKGCYFLLK